MVDQGNDYRKYGNYITEENSDDDDGQVNVRPGKKKVRNRCESERWVAREGRR